MHQLWVSRRLEYFDNGFNGLLGCASKSGPPLEIDLTTGRKVNR